jgi:hypothetical protein
MSTENFEDILKNMEKPDVNDLKHAAMLPGMISKTKGRSVVSLWWLFIPLYVIATLLMKSFYVPGTSLTSLLHDFASSKTYTSVLLFYILPVLLIIINIASIKQLYFLYGSLTKTGFLKIVWSQLIIIIISLLVLFVAIH